MARTRYEFDARVIRVVDGDTLDLRVDLGFTVDVEVRARLYGIDTPEVYGVKHSSGEYARGKEASAFAIDWLVESLLGKGSVHDAQVLIVSHDGRKIHTGKYGRWLVEVYRDGDAKSLNQALVDAGHAVLKDY